MKKILLATVAVLAAMCATSCGNKTENSSESSDAPVVYQSDINEANGKEYIKKTLETDKSFVQTESGIIYKVLKEGQGANFTESDVVMTKYEGKHIDGKVFDDGGGKAVPFSCDRVIKGFAEMLKLMKPGMKVEVVIPSELAYGARGVTDGEGNEVIGANETLIFTMETINAQ